MRSSPFQTPVNHVLLLSHIQDTVLKSSWELLEGIKFKFDRLLMILHLLQYDSQCDSSVYF